MPESGKSTSSVGDFIAVFVAIERRIRALGARHGLIAPQIEQGRYVPLRQLVKWLVSREVLGGDLARRLDELTRYRNLLVHGHVDSVKDVILEEARTVARELDESQQKET
jgi:hypothetical protein